MSGALRVAFVGASRIAFSGAIGHSTRLERILGDRLVVVAIVDPDAARAERALADKLAGPSARHYADCKIHSSVQRMLTSPGPAAHLVIVASPPSCRGSVNCGADCEVQIAASWPGVSIFVERPISLEPVPSVQAAVSRINDSASVVAVGYHLRALRVVQDLKSLLRENNLQVVSLSALFSIPQLFSAWTLQNDYSPMVEVATDFVDLARYIAGPVNLSSIVSMTTESDEPAGSSSISTSDGQSIVPDPRVPRAVQSMWKHTNGAVGALHYVAAMHDGSWMTEMSVIAPGWTFRIADLYTPAPILVYRGPGGDFQTLRYEDDDPYSREIEAFLKARETGRAEDASCTFADACASYEFSCRIRQAGDRSLDTRHTRHRSDSACSPSLASRSRTSSSGA